MRDLLSTEELSSCGTLGLDPQEAAQLTQKQLSTAFRTRQKTRHVDKGGSHEDSAGLNIAYTTLKDYITRRDSYALLKQPASNDSERKQQIQLLMRFFLTEGVKIGGRNPNDVFFNKAYQNLLNFNTAGGWPLGSTADEKLLDYCVSLHSRLGSAGGDVEMYMFQILFVWALNGDQTSIELLQTLEDFFPIYSSILEIDALETFYAELENLLIINTFRTEHVDLFNKIFLQAFRHRFSDATTAQQEAYLLYLQKAIDQKCLFNTIKYSTLEDMVDLSERDLGRQIESRKHERAARLECIKYNPNDVRADVGTFHSILTTRIVSLMALFLVDRYTEKKCIEWFGIQFQTLKDWARHSHIDNFRPSHVGEILLDLLSSESKIPLKERILYLLSGVLLELTMLKDPIATSFFKRFSSTPALNALFYQYFIHLSKPDINKYNCLRSDFVNQVLASKHEPEVCILLCQLINKYDKQTFKFSLQEAACWNVSELTRMCRIAEFSRNNRRIIIKESSLGSFSVGSFDVQWQHGWDGRMLSFPVDLLQLESYDFSIQEIDVFAKALYEQQCLSYCGERSLQALQARGYQALLQECACKNNEVKKMKIFFASAEFKVLEEKIFTPLINDFPEGCYYLRSFLLPPLFDDLSNIIATAAKTNKDILPAVNAYLIEKFNEMINNPFLNQYFSPLIAFFKGLLGVLLALPVLGIPLAFETYRDVFFKPPVIREMKKMKRELQVISISKQALSGG